MVGCFESERLLKESLRSEGFQFCKIQDGYVIFVNKKAKQIAQINVYADMSASALYGSYSVNL